MSNFIEMRKEDTRPCIIIKNGRTEKAFFHMWMKRKRIFKDEPKEVLLAVVELENGSITQTYADNIRFTDRVVAEAKTENEPQEGLFGEE